MDEVKNLRRKRGEIKGSISNLTKDLTNYLVKASRTGIF